mgnify:FL=1
MDDIQNKLTEDKTVLLLIDYLKANGYVIEDYCLGHNRGIDIISSKNNKKFLIEVKGAKAYDNSPIKKRKFFDSGQLKAHLGKAIVKSLETQKEYKDADVGIAHPDDEYIRKTIGSVTPELKRIGISHLWVNKNGKVEFD